jgi:hypothetical protein
MPSTYADIAAPVAPQGIKDWADGVDEYIERDWQKAKSQTQMPAVNALSWNAHDKELRQIVSDYNRYLASTPGYHDLDWHLIKAMLFVETNPEQKGWDKSPMQSNNQGDAGYGDLTSKPDRVALLVPPTLRNSLSCANINAAGSITAGVAYLLSQAAIFGEATVNADQKTQTVKVEKYDSLYTLAKKVGTTEALMQKLNPHVNFHNLQPGTVLNYQKAKIVTVITGWKTIDENSIYSLYNRNPRLAQRYTQQLGYAYRLIKQNKFLQ